MTLLHRLLAQPWAVSLLLPLLWVGPAGPAQASEEAWALLKQGGHHVLMRHAHAPGFSEEPPGIDLRNCALQRNLDEAGRAQARRIGEEFRKRGLTQARIVSSQFCRTLETARLLGLGKVQELPALNYLNFEDPKIDVVVANTTTFLQKSPPRPVTIAVTHISNIKAVTYINPSSGEMVIVRFDAGGTLRVAGRISPP